MPHLDDRSLPALPSEEEERALGIRRPAFIPATEERRGNRPTRARIISGSLSIFLLVIGSCGLSAFLIKSRVLPQLNAILHISTPAPFTKPVATVPSQYLTPGTVLTPSGKASPITTIGMYKKIVEGAGNGPATAKDPSALFFAGDNIYVVMEVSEDAKTNDVVSVKWTFNNVDITNALKTTKSDCCAATIQSGGKRWQEIFLISIPNSGYGKVEVYYNKDLIATALFAVIIPSSTYPPSGYSFVPDVAGLSLSKACDRIVAANLKCNQGPSERGSQPAGTVARTDPPYESQVPPGTVVTVFLSLGQ